MSLPQVRQANSCTLTEGDTALSSVPRKREEQISEERVSWRMMSQRVTLIQRVLSLLCDWWQTLAMRLGAMILHEHCCGIWYQESVEIGKPLWPQLDSIVQPFIETSSSH